MASKIGRNDPCTCGSNKKYKNCCGRGTGRKGSHRLNQVMAGLVFSAGLVAAGLAYVNLGADDPVVEDPITLKSSPLKSKVPPPPFEVKATKGNADSTITPRPLKDLRNAKPKPMDSLPLEIRNDLERQGIYKPKKGLDPVDTNKTGTGK